MACFDDLSACELIALANLVAIAISQQLTVQEINTLITFLSAVASNLSILSNEKDQKKNDTSNIGDIAGSIPTLPL